MSAVRTPTTPAVTEPQVLEVRRDMDRVELSLLVPPDLAYFRGHFPAHPVLPGVVQLEWVMNYARAYLAFGDRSARSVRIKFRRIIRPGDRVKLTLGYQPERHQLDFTYADADGVRSSGRIGLALR